MKISHGDDLAPLHEGSWRDRDGDIWAMGHFGLMRTPDTAPFGPEHVVKKWGPLVSVGDEDDEDSAEEMSEAEVNAELDELDRLREEIGLLHAYAHRTDDHGWGQLLDALLHPDDDLNVIMLIEPDEDPLPGV